MENRRRISEEDLLVTEALIAASYGQLKESAFQAPARALRSVGKTAHEHPYATAATAVVAGVALYGIFRIITSRPSGQEDRNNPRQKGMGGTDLLQGLLPMIIPMVTPYIAGYIKKYLGKIQS